MTTTSTTRRRRRREYTKASEPCGFFWVCWYQSVRLLGLQRYKNNDKTAKSRRRVLSKKRRVVRSRVVRARKLSVMPPHVCGVSSAPLEYVVLPEKKRTRRGV